MPLLLESLIPIVGAYLVGVGLAWFFFGRPKRDSYL
jgi:plastocyanin domain-containing protein